MQIFVISLERSLERRASIEQQFNSLALDFTFFNAVDAGSGEQLAFPNYTDSACLNDWRRPLSPSEVACFASHYQLWQFCKANNQPIVVLEDDAVLGDQFRQALDLAASAIDQFGYIRLEAWRPRPSIVVAAAPADHGLAIVRYFKGPKGTAGYVISPDGADKLLRRASRWLVPVDDYIDHFWLHKVFSIGIEPPQVRQSGAMNTIMDRPVEKSTGEKIKHELRIVVENVQRFIENTKFKFLS